MEMVQRRCFTFLQCQIRSWILWQRTRMRLEPEIAEYSFFHYFFLQLQLPKIQLDRDRKSTSIFFGIEILKFQPLKVDGDGVHLKNCNGAHRVTPGRQYCQVDRLIYKATWLLAKERVWWIVLISLYTLSVFSLLCHNSFDNTGWENWRSDRLTKDRLH